MYTMNIGVNSPVNPTRVIDMASIANTMRHIGIVPDAIRFQHDDVEDFFIVVVRKPYVFANVLMLSDALGQDCIAVGFGGGGGELVGSNCADWGEFNPAFFTTF